MVSLPAKLALLLGVNEKIMINDIQITKNSNENNKIDLTCGNCKRTTKHIIHSEICVNGSQEMHPYEGTYHWSDEYQIIQCQGCETFSFRKTHQNSDDICQTYNGDFEPELFIDVYPNPEEGRKLVNDYDLLPSDLYRIYVETIKSINSNLPVLTGIGIRAIVKTVCKNQKANGKNLLDKIDDLVTQGVLTKDGLIFYIN